MTTAHFLNTYLKKLQKSGPAFFPSYMMDLNRKIDLSPILPKSDTMSSSERLDDLSNKIAFSDKMPKIFFVRIKKVGFDDDYVAVSLRMKILPQSSLKSAFIKSI